MHTLDARSVVTIALGWIALVFLISAVVTYAIHAATKEVLRCRECLGSGVCSTRIGSRFICRRCKGKGYRW